MQAVGVISCNAVKRYNIKLWLMTENSGCDFDSCEAPIKLIAMMLGLHNNKTEMILCRPKRLLLV